jgi:hypothetical protein
MMLPRLLRFLPLALLILAVPRLPAAAPRSTALDLRDGDTLVFLGDSITHQCLFTWRISSTPATPSAGSASTTPV